MDLKTLPALGLMNGHSPVNGTASHGDGEEDSTIITRVRQLTGMESREIVDMALARLDRLSPAALLEEVVHHYQNRVTQQELLDIRGEEEHRNA